MNELTPYRPGPPLAPEHFTKVRRAMILDHCKWDPQVGDVSTLADFPLIMPRATWQKLATWAEALTAEANAAERELALRAELHGRLGLPRRFRKALQQRCAEAAVDAMPRAYRYDFHLTTDGWRISECNADVPGGYAEASAFTALMAEHYPTLMPAGDPAAAWAHAIAVATQTGDVALVAAVGFMEDAQVIHYLARRLHQRGLRAHCLQPAQIEWRDGLAFFGARQLGALVRFYQAEWLTSLPASAGWQHYVRGARTPVLNPATCVTIESKRFPLVWDALRAPLATWRRLLPATADPRDVPWEHDDAWLLKTALCNTGDTVSARSLMPPAGWAKAARSARWFPGGWVAQRRFEPVPLATPLGAVFPCIGLYTIDGQACGAYARLSHGPIVDYAAVDIALLLENDHVARA